MKIYIEFNDVCADIEIDQALINISENKINYIAQEIRPYIYGMLLKNKIVDESVEIELSIDKKPSKFLLIENRLLDIAKLPYGKGSQSIFIANELKPLISSFLYVVWVRRLFNV